MLVAICHRKSAHTTGSVKKPRSYVSGTVTLHEIRPYTRRLLSSSSGSSPSQDWDSQDFKMDLHFQCVCVCVCMCVPVCLPVPDHSSTPPVCVHWILIVCACIRYCICTSLCGLCLCRRVGVLTLFVQVCAGVCAHVWH